MPRDSTTRRRAIPRRDATSTVELVALAEAIREQSRQLGERDERIAALSDKVEEWSATAAIWQTHALHLQSRVEQLEVRVSIEAGVERNKAVDDAESEQTLDHESAASVRMTCRRGGVWARLARWIAGE